MPSCLGASASDFVLAMRIAQSAARPAEVHTLRPFTRQTSPSRSAFVVSEARSLPASGSENIWHHTRSPRTVRGRWSALLRGRTEAQQGAGGEDQADHVEHRRCFDLGRRLPECRRCARASAPARPPRSASRCRRIPRRGARLATADLRRFISTGRIAPQSPGRSPESLRAASQVRADSAYSATSIVERAPRPRP